MNRRGFLFNVAAGLFLAPAIVRAESLMRIASPSAHLRIVHADGRVEYWYPNADGSVLLPAGVYDTIETHGGPALTNRLVLHCDGALTILTRLGP